MEVCIFSYFSDKFYDMLLFYAKHLNDYFLKQQTDIPVEYQKLWGLERTPLSRQEVIG